MSLNRMLKEEWRMHSRVYNGKAFAAFPLLVFGMAAALGYGVNSLSTLDAPLLLKTLPGFALFLGLGVGSVGFSSRGASKGVLGDYTLTIHSSRTLPVSSERLLAEFVAKDLIYYTAMVLLPVGAGVALTAGFSAQLGLMPLYFAGGLAAAFGFARSSLELPGFFSPSFAEIGLPMVERSELDVERSPGGLLKILFSFGVLAGFYWFLVLNFPAASVFLQNPLLSFAVLTGTISLAMYNWLNRFDSWESYDHMPVERGEVIEAKQKAFVRMNLPVLLLVLLAPFVVYGGNLALSIMVSASVSTYALGSASQVLGLEPNTRVYETGAFARLVLLNGFVTVPLLVGSIAGFPAEVIALMSGLTAVSGLALMRHSVLEIN